jgi:putative SOS response-associated peptidase YedK
MLCGMCNAYRVQPKKKASGLEAAVSEVIRGLPSDLVRRTGPGVVVTPDGGDLRPSTMRWGFHRHFSDAINNARSDNFKSPVWAEALASRRCLVPISVFYEWQPLPNGRKQAFEFRREDGDWMWIAGLWEDSEKHGPCYATITTEPSALVEPIHDRMLAVVDFTEGESFLRGGSLPFLPYTGPLVAMACESPLRRTAPRGGSEQGDLF